LRYLYGKPDGVADDAWSSPILTSSGNNKVSGSTAADFIDGKAGNDRLNGGDGADTILGGDGNDKISGDAGNDILYGGAGVDQLTGGSGADSFVFDYPANGNADKIKDFNVVEGDVFAFDVEVFSALAGGISAGNVVVAANAIAQDADDFLLFSTKGGRLYYDADGNGSGAAVLLAGVKGNLSGLDADNFTIEIGA
jgi:Ca2+-binding RTX toxin-like protein